MSVRVNLLRPDEVRPQTGISRESLGRIGGIIGSILAVAGLVWMVFQYTQVRSGHAYVKERWAIIESDYERVKEVHAAHEANQKYLRELEGWTASRITWSKPLIQLQQQVPENIQLTRMTVQAQIAESESVPKKKDKPGTPARRYSLRLEGLAIGDMSDQDVIRFVDELRGASEFQEWVDFVKLQSLERSSGYRDEEDAEDERTFRVDAASLERLLQS